MKGSLSYISKCTGSRNLRRRRIGSTRSQITIALKHKASGTATLVPSTMLRNGSMSGFCAHKGIRCLALDRSQPRKRPFREVVWPVLADVEDKLKKKVWYLLARKIASFKLANGASFLPIFACLVSTSDEWRRRSSCVHLGPEIVPDSSKNSKFCVQKSISEALNLLSHRDRREVDIRIGECTAGWWEQGYFTQTKCMFSFEDKKSCKVHAPKETSHSSRRGENVATVNCLATTCSLCTNCKPVEACCCKARYREAPRNMEDAP